MRLAKNENIKIGFKLQEARIASGYTQEQVAELAGCSSRYIGQLETDLSTGSVSFIIFLCNLYNLTLNDLYGEYINVSTDLKDNIPFCGYIALNDEYKSIVDNVITHLRKLQNSKK